jgi:hypothetical protein
MRMGWSLSILAPALLYNLRIGSGPTFRGCWRRSSGGGSRAAMRPGHLVRKEMMGEDP